MPAIGDALVGLAGEADDTGRDLNKCIDKYNAVKKVDTLHRHD
jgi:hypothetical protein